ncbi:hypothetical protein [Nitratiruptor tergarcus]|uniref:SurA N-terminal domain-containing protein n=1 Tax=Nitratiruptor tergarcus DSM 16512 TaxID=1069081 RepID=A0A1W1WV23_9BACT|nr:hypothetical protein [Nitratiruptor tergarcus]SMC10168.1 hypothetical protein SAMN05660197_2010 [Nitratiruptor tergarcus DSM 16512]
MRKLFLLSLIAISLFAIDIKISPDKNITVSYQDTKAIKTFYQEVFKFRLADEGAYKLAEENRILANAYIKRYGLDNNDIARIKVETELYLANHMVKNIQNSIKLSDKVLYSYYIDHKDQFKGSDKVDLVIFYFKDPEKAVDFYIKAKGKTLEEAKKIASKDIVIKEYKNLDIKKMKPFFQNIIQKYGPKHFLPPIFDEVSSVSYIQDYHKAQKYKKFEDVKEEIRKLLYSKTFLRERNKILLQYKSGKK